MTTDFYLQEMEQERLAKEAEEQEKAEREKKIKDTFDDTNTQWAKDKSEMQNIAKDTNKEAQDPEGSRVESKDAPSQEKSNTGSKDTKQNGLVDA